MTGALVSRQDAEEEAGGEAMGAAGLDHGSRTRDSARDGEGPMNWGRRMQGGRRPGSPAPAPVLLQRSGRLCGAVWLSSRPCSRLQAALGGDIASHPLRETASLDETPRLNQDILQPLRSHCFLETPACRCLPSEVGPRVSPA